MIAIATEHPRLKSFIRIARSNGVEQRSWGLPKTADSYVKGLRTSRLPFGGRNESLSNESELSERSIDNPQRYLRGVRS